MRNILTGDRPSGLLHLGHYVGSLENRLLLQNDLNKLQYNNFFLMIADTQSLTDNFNDPQKVRESVVEVVKDYIAVGIDPAKWNIFLQSQVPELFELTAYFMNLVTLNNLQRVPTLKHEIKQKGFGDNLPMGFINYPISQAADLLLFDAVKAPVGEDQVSIIELTNEISRKYNNMYGCERFVHVDAILSKNPRLVGIDGKAKASKSLNNAIFLSDSADKVKQKVGKMYTDPEHITVDSPGKVEGNVVFDYLDAFYKDKIHLSELKSHYQKGGLGDQKTKNILTECLNNFLEPIRAKRSSITSEYVLEVISSGSAKAKEYAAGKMRKVRKDLGLL